MGAENQIYEKPKNETELLLDSLTKSQKKERYLKLRIQRHSFDCCNHCKIESSNHERRCFSECLEAKMGNEMKPDMYDCLTENLVPCKNKCILECLPIY